MECDEQPAIFIGGIEKCLDLQILVLVSFSRCTVFVL
jgi:hypothetical protein